MSFYNVLFGVNSMAPVLLKILDIDQKNGIWESGRFRDIYLNRDGTEIILYTRNGGGNRNCMETTDYSTEKERESADSENCKCPACIMNYNIPKHPNYVKDYDDDFDDTYAYIVFNVPEKYKELCKTVKTMKEPETIYQKYKNLIDLLKETLND